MRPLFWYEEIVGTAFEALNWPHPIIVMFTCLEDGIAEWHQCTKNIRGRRAGPA